MRINLKVAKSQMFRQSGVMLVSILIARAFSYVFYFIMARMLTPAEYGELGALISFFFIVTVFTTGVQPIIAKFTAEFYHETEKGKLKSFILLAFKRILFYGVVGFVIVSAISPLISSFLHISGILSVMIIAIAFTLNAILVVFRGFLQGIGDFTGLGINISLETILRVIFGSLLVLFGFGVNGAVASLAIAIFVCMAVGVVPLRFLVGEKEERIEIRSVYSFSVPVILTAFATVAMLNFDILLVKHFFDSKVAGHYVAASLLAKVPLILARESLSPVVFTKAVVGGKDVLRKSVIYTLIIIAPIIAIYWFIPGIIVTILYGKAYIESADFMRLLVVPMSVMGINTILINYLMAKEKMEFVKFLIFILILEIVLIFLFHELIFHIISVVFLSYSLLLLILLMQFFSEKRIKIRIPFNN